MQLVGVDTGGTFTDSVLIRSDGSVGVGKALSTPGSLEVGVLESIEAAAANVGIGAEEALAAADFVVHTTRGFEATVPMARANVVRGIDEGYKTEAIRWSKPPLLLSRRCIRGVTERIDADVAVVGNTGST